MITHYFLQVAHPLAFQNNLQRDIYDFLKGLSSTVIFAADFEPAKKMILDRIGELEKKHPRCKPLQCSWSRFSHDTDVRIQLYGFHAASFYIYKATFTNIKN